MSDRQPILVIGGTRGTGLLIARLLDQRGRAVRVLARNPAAATTRLGPTIQVVAGDITREETLSQAVIGAAHIVFTAGVRSGHPAREAQVRATEYQGVLNTLVAAQRAGFAGRFLYMTSSGVTRRSLSTLFLNLYKGNTLVWRRKAEEAIRGSGLDYTIIRAGFLLNRRGGRRAILVTQDALPLTPRYHIARADVAEAFVAALDDRRTSRTTFDVIWGRGSQRESWSTLFDGLRADAGLGATLSTTS